MLKQLSALLTFVAVLLVPAVASAHVIVTPSQAGVGQELVFNVSSPNERQVAITKVVLDIPHGVTDVVPTTKDGWTVVTGSNGSAGQVSSITWDGGQIPVGQRTDFSFGAQVPATATSLDWKAYQTYADGTVVHWDQTPTGSDDANGTAGPFSVTKVVNDLTASSKPTQTNSLLPTVVAVAALVVACAAWLRSATTGPKLR